MRAQRTAPPRRPGPFRRALFRLPLLLEHFGGRHLARLFAAATGVQWITLETIGRRSGRPHRVVLDVVGYDRTRDAYYVQPAYGRTAHWVLNAIAHPQVTAGVSGQWFDAQVRDASGAEGAEVVLRFLRAHPRYGRVIVWFVRYVDRIDRPEDDLRRALAATPVFAVEVIRDRASPPA
ncbi:MAG: nitroreductase family deazaflavin-dependent oxidoreductase [Candidatus Binatia bacterium]